MAGVLDSFIQLREDNDLQPEDIEKVIAQLHPMVQFEYASQNTLTTPDDYCFNIRYLLACAAHRIDPAHWHDLAVRKDPKVRHFMERLDLSIIVDEEDFALAKLKDPRTYQMRIELVAKGKTFKEKIPYLRGTWDPKEFRNTDEELVKKFIANTSKVLHLDKAKKAAQIILRLDSVEKMNEIMELIAP